MNDDRFTNREITLMFESIKSSLETIKSDIKENAAANDIRFKRIDDEMGDIRRQIKDLDSFKIRALAVWGTAIGIATFFVNRFL